MSLTMKMQGSVFPYDFISAMLGLDVWTNMRSDVNITAGCAVADSVFVADNVACRKVIPKVTPEQIGSGT